MDNLYASCNWSLCNDETHYATNFSHFPNKQQSMRSYYQNTWFWLFCNRDFKEQSPLKLNPVDSKTASAASMIMKVARCEV